jgi:cell division protein FtsL
MRKGREIWAVMIAFGSAIVLAMALVWVNIQRVDLAYDLQKMQARLSQKEELGVKLEIERNNLLAPARLRFAATKAGLYEVRPGQMRKLDDSGYE